MSTTTIEQKAKDLVKRAYTLTTEALKETGAGGSRLEQLIIALTPRVFEAISNHAYTEKPQATPVTAVTPIPPIPGNPLSSPTGLFEEFKKRLPAELRPLLRVRDHSGIEILITSVEKLASADFAAVCRVAEELKGKWISAGRDSAWRVPLYTNEKR
jgi:hypothetical protein